MGSGRGRMMGVGLGAAALVTALGVAPTPVAAADTLSVTVVAVAPSRTTGPITLSGSTNRPGAVITISDAGQVICTTTGPATSATTTFPFACSGTLTGTLGVHTLTVEAKGPKGNVVTTTAAAELIAPPPPTAPITVGVSTVAPNPTTGPVTLTGTVNRPTAAITVTNQDGTALCATTGASALTGTAYPWTCSGNVSGKAGLKTLSVKAVGPSGGIARATATVTKDDVATPPDPFAVTVSGATPNPTTGPIDVVGATNRPSAVVVVRNQDGSDLCTATSAAVKTGTTYPFQCAGSVTGRSGMKTLSVRATGPNGAVSRTTFTVTKEAVVAPPAAFGFGAITVSPSPSSGVVTVTGSTNRPGAAIVVWNQDGTVLCSAAGSVQKVSNAYAFSCTGTLSGLPGDKVLSLKATGPNGNSIRTVATATKR